MKKNILITKLFIDINTNNNHTATVIWYDDTIVINKLKKLKYALQICHIQIRFFQLEKLLLFFLF